MRKLKQGGPKAQSFTTVLNRHIYHQGWKSSVEVAGTTLLYPMGNCEVSMGNENKGGKIIECTQNESHRPLSISIVG